MNLKSVIFENVFFASLLALVKNTFIDVVYFMQLVLLLFFSNEGMELHIFCPLTGKNSSLNRIVL